MIHPARRAAQGFPHSALASVVSGYLPGLCALAGLLLLTWGASLWMLHNTRNQREAAAYRMASDETLEAEQHIVQILSDADRTLLDLRSQYPGAGLNEALSRQGQIKPAGGIALLAADGHVEASSPHANTAGWPVLMARLKDSADVLAIGEPAMGKNRAGLIPVARRVTEPGGAFAGILMVSLDGDSLARLQSTIASYGGSVALVDDDGLVLARTPPVRGAVGLRVRNLLPLPGQGRSAAEGTGHHVSEIDSMDRYFAYRHLSDAPLTVVAAVARDAMFGDWDNLRDRAIGTAALETILILLTILLWYGQRRSEAFSAQTLMTVLSHIDTGVRVERADGALLLANDAGAVLAMPDGAEARAEVEAANGDRVEIVRHRLANGGSVLIASNITAREASAARIDFLTHHDPLTGLPNRWRAAARIQTLLASKTRHGPIAALILFDLDGFQDINDTLGHEAGDQVLTDVSGRLRDLVSAGDVVARLGGDEFLLFLAEAENAEEVDRLAQHIPRVLARPIAVRGQQVRLGASMGIALYPADGDDAATLFRHADIALSRAKMAGRGRAQRFEPHMMVAFEEHRMMESDLRRALDSDELELRLQPQFSCETLEVTGFEALARWRHPVRGEVSPTIFIPIAERSGLIIPLGLWAIEQACLAAAGWSTRHRVAVNLSPLQLRGETIQDDIRAILRRTQFPAHLLELEVTESVLLDENQQTLETLHKLRAMDIRITLDDFGTGYSSLSYLRRFPFDKVKIDKSYIQGQSTDRVTRVILEAMVRMCSDLGFDVVAEGVETEAQLTETRALGCQEVQGFLLGAPLYPHEVNGFLSGRGRRAGAGIGQNQKQVLTSF